MPVPKSLSELAVKGIILGLVNAGNEVVDRGRNTWKEWDWREFSSDDLDKYPITSRLIAKTAQKAGEVVAKHLDQTERTKTGLGPKAKGPRRKAKPPKSKRARKGKTYRIDRDWDKEDAAREAEVEEGFDDY